MGFSIVPTVTTGDSWSAANHNTYIRDNFAAVWVGENAGDMEYYTGATTKAKIPIGAAGNILAVNGSANGYEFISGIVPAEFSLSADFSFAGNQSPTPINTWQAVSDPGGWLNADHTNFDLDAGTYLISMHCDVGSIPSAKAANLYLYRLRSAVDTTSNGDYFYNYLGSADSKDMRIVPQILTVLDGDQYRFKVDTDVAGTYKVDATAGLGTHLYIARLK